MVGGGAGSIYEYIYIYIYTHTYAVFLWVGSANHLGHGGKYTSLYQSNPRYHFSFRNKVFSVAGDNQVSQHRPCFKNQSLFLSKRVPQIVVAHNPDWREGILETQNLGVWKATTLRKFLCASSLSKFLGAKRKHWGPLSQKTSIFSGLKIHNCAGKLSPNLDSRRKAVESI